jgi:site-specific DNA-methyltransferase (adenine-specific)/modification methylase
MDKLIEQNVKMDMILCDLPFGTTKNKWDLIIPLDELWKRYNKLIKHNGVIALCCVEPFTSMLITNNVKMFKYKLVWEKSKATNFLNAKKQPLRKYEEISIFYKKQPTYNPQMREGKPYNKGIRKDQLTGSYGDFKPVEVKSDGKRYPTDILYFKTAESEGKVLHSTQKPIALMEYLINTYSNKDDLILDNCMGSGTTGVACKKLHRKFVGIELDNTYFNIAVDRINNTSIDNN